MSSLSLNGLPDDGEDELVLPPFDPGARADLENPVASDQTETEFSISLTVGDDSSIEEEPARHVDYLSHHWREEDIWASWRYVLSRRDWYSNGVRLENALWRTWAKSKNNLRTVSPETLNWLKDCDVTWLYGPLQTDHKQKSTSNNSPPPSQLSSTNSFLDRKPILKKKTASEAILQRSLFQYTLLKHAGAILQAQKAEHTRSRPTFSRATSDVGVSLGRRSVDYCFDSTDSTSTLSNSTSSGLVSPLDRRHIHFNNKVVQCIAVKAEDDKDQDQLNFLGEEDVDIESDNGIVMMKQISSRPFISNRSTPRGSFSNESKTIAPLPPTTLKYRGDTPELPPWNPSPFNGSKLSSSPSIKTLRPKRPKANFLLDEDEQEDWMSMPSDQPWFANPQDKDELELGGNLHLTSSGMLMPEDGESSYHSLFRRVMDTVNTARDIAHVIWNFGWRR